MWPLTTSRFDRIVAVEHHEQRDQFVLYRRTTSGETVEITVTSNHYFVVDSLDLVPKGSSFDVVSLGGDLSLKHLVLCESYSAYKTGLRSARDKGRALYGASASDHMWFRSPVESFLMRSGITQFVGLNPTDLKIVALDFEMYTSDGKHFADAEDPNDQIILASLTDNSGNSYLIDAKTWGEAGLINEVCRLIKLSDYDVICGHNLVGFDLPYLVARAKRHSVPLLLGRDNSPLLEHSLKRRYALREGPEYNVFGRHIIDTLPLLINWDITTRVLDNYQLKTAVVALGITAQDRRDFDRREISTLWDEQPHTLKEYAVNDALDSLALYNFLSPPLFFQTQLLPLTYQQCASTGTGTKVDISLIRAYLQRAHSLPLRGALVSGEGRGGLTDAKSLGWHKEVHKADVASLYPSICLTYNIKPRTDSLDAFPALLQFLTERRLQAKAQLKLLTPETVEHKALDALQNSLKILINSFYGMLGTSGLYFSDSKASNEITDKGQEILLQMVANVETRKGTVIEIDTDGIYFTLPEKITTNVNISDVVAYGLPPTIRVDYDGYYDFMYSYASKNYLLVQGDKIIRKGVVFRSRRLFGLQEELIEACVIKLCKEDIAGLAEYYRDMAKRVRQCNLSVSEVSTYYAVDQSLAEYELSLKTGGQRSRPLDLIAARPDRDRWTLRSKIYYYHASNGGLKLSEEYSSDVDISFYLELLRKTAEKFLYAFQPEDWHNIFSELPLSSSLHSHIKTWSFNVVGNQELMQEYERVLKGDFRLRLF